MEKDKQKLIRIIQSSWTDWVRRINSEQEQFEKGLDKGNLSDRLEQELMAKAYSKRRELARKTYLVELSVIKRAHHREDMHYLNIPRHIIKPKYF